MFDDTPTREEAAVDDAVVKAVAAHHNGVGARTLVGKMENRFSPNAVSNSIQRTLDSGQLELGSKLELRVSNSAQG